MKIACIDDEPQEGEFLLDFAKDEFSKYKISVKTADYYSSGDAFFRIWRPGRYRLIFLDIFLHQESGIEIARMIRKNDPGVAIVFCSSSNEFASESYEVRADYYLTKPVSDQAMAKMIHRLNLLSKEEDMLELPDHRMLRLSQFVYSEYHNHLITIYLKNGTTEKIWSSQTEFLKQLESFHYFLPANPGTIVNLKEVCGFDNDVFQMSNGSFVSISRRKKKELVSSYQNYLFSELRKAE